MNYSPNDRQPPMESFLDQPGAGLCNRGVEILRPMHELLLVDSIKIEFIDEPTVNQKWVAPVSAVLTVGSCSWRAPGFIEPCGCSPIGEVVCRGWYEELIQREIAFEISHRCGRCRPLNGGGTGNLG